MRRADLRAAVDIPVAHRFSGKRGAYIATENLCVTGITTGEEV
jgi:hypothetical protein